MVLAEWVASTHQKRLTYRAQLADQYQLILQENNVVEIVEENIVYDEMGMMSGYIVAERDDSHVELHVD